MRKPIYQWFVPIVKLPEDVKQVVSSKLLKQSTANSAEIAFDSTANGWSASVKVSSIGSGRSAFAFEGGTTLEFWDLWINHSLREYYWCFHSTVHVDVYSWLMFPSVNTKLKSLFVSKYLENKQKRLKVLRKDSRESLPTMKIWRKKVDDWAMNNEDHFVCADSPIAVHPDFRDDAYPTQKKGRGCRLKAKSFFRI